VKTMSGNQVTFRGSLTSGNLSSPDIYNAGVTEMDPILLGPTLITNWTTPSPNPIMYVGANILYVRGTANVTQAGVKFRMYYVRSDLTSGYSTSAKSQVVKTISGASYSTAV
jgi:hypothetical protein